MSFCLNDYLTAISRLLDEWTGKNLIAACNSPSKGLYDSMLYSLNAGGKRMRSALLVMCYDLFRKSLLDAGHPALSFAVAVELVHTYSLIHDDLPGMDNDDLRRGKPTNHRVYGEATAILAGDGLLTKAFEIFINHNLHSSIPVDVSCAAAYELAKAIGPDGMVAGQYADINPDGKMANTKLVEYIHIHKTADFIAVCAKIGAILADASPSDAICLESYGQKIGLAFQIIDDILDITSTTSELGKTQGKDEKRNKLTYPKAYGIDYSKQKAKDLIEEAISFLSIYGENAEPLRSFAMFVAQRKK